MGQGFEDVYDSQSDDDDIGEPTGAECKRCGARDLVWEKIAFRWRLVTVGGRLHVCPVNDPRLDFAAYIKRTP